MGVVLLTWELGFGIGHLMNLRPIGQELIRRGHRVVAAVRDLPRAREVLGKVGIDCVSAPLAMPRGGYPFEFPQGYAHLLGNLGFVNDAALGGLFTRWNDLFDAVQPSLVVADHSPTALLALWGRAIPRVNVGLAFFCPPDHFPLPAWPRDGHPNRMEQLMEDERHVTATVNGVLEKWRRPPLARLSQFFNQIDEVVLATYREFDLFGPRKEARFWGHWPFGVGTAPVWPQKRGPKVFSYLKASPILEPMCEALGQSGFPTVMFVAEVNENWKVRNRYSSLEIVTQPLSLQEAACQCDLAVTNGGHGTVATLLLAGKPCLMVPLSVEQALFGRAVERLGAGRLLSGGEPAELKAALMDIATSTTHHRCAQDFAGCYSGWTPGQQIPELVDRLQQLMN